MSDILLQRDGPIATVVFNRPRMRNAINLAMWSEIERVSVELAEDDTVRGVVYRGAGTEAFASGADISEFQENRKDIETSLALWRADRGRLRGDDPRLSQADDRDDPWLLHGRRHGGRDGLRPALRGRGLEVRDPGRPAQHHLRRRLGGDLVGPAYAKDILYSARAVGDQEALAIGFIQRLLPSAQLEASTYDYLRSVADNAPLSVRGAKATVQVYLAGLDDVRRKHLKQLSLEAFESQDYKEGTRAFLEKRPPRFQGR